MKYTEIIIQTLLSQYFQLNIYILTILRLLKANRSISWGPISAIVPFLLSSDLSSQHNLIILIIIKVKVE